MPMKHQPTDQMLAHIAARFRALSDETRLRLLLALQGGERSVGALAEELGAAQASISKHLAVLKAAGLVDSRREGPSSLHRVRDESIFQMCDIMCDGVRRHAAETHAALGLHQRPRARPAAPR
jgi:ArsR family transcriptional regulator